MGGDARTSRVASDMEVYDGCGYKLNYGVLGLLRVPYDFAPGRHTPNVINVPVNASPAKTKPEAASLTLTAIDAGALSVNTIRYETPELSVTQNHFYTPHWYNSIL